ncbi:DMT family transporter [Malaciobacter mytili]|uniref:EamA family transporter n=1 Tax=Malaciobacter mytili LMG 24559 TaxID=1032238 RepID=A0AAX2AJZ1_9BACT|nr:DMT family transporter [Malaciobacter mytili]AXH14329.1 EamA/RhaT family transporter [Malaciobacter mytili LMG 24559]RXK16551.1 EamA family transporter [Malaciobacter mytili LMG 24559]
MTQTNKNIFYIMMIFAMAGWGASWVNAKVLSSYINEYELIFFRNIFTLLTLTPILIFAKKYFYINKKSLFLAFLASLVMIAYMKCYFLGTKFGTASLGGALVTTLIPINTFLIMAIFFNKKIQKKDFLALGVGAIGVLTILQVWSFNFEQIFTIYNAYFLAGSLLWAILTIISSRSTKTSPMVFTFYMYVITTILVVIFFLDFKAINYQSFDWIFWVNILILSVISTTFATTVYFVGIEKLGANEVSSFVFLVPFFAILFSVIFLKEHISLSIILGTVMTIYAVKILNNIKVFKK